MNLENPAYNLTLATGVVNQESERYVFFLGVCHKSYELRGEDRLGAQAYQELCPWNNCYKKFGKHSNHVMSCCW